MAKNRKDRTSGNVISLVDKDAPNYAQQMARLLREIADEVEAENIGLNTAVVCVHVEGYLPDVYAVGADVDDGQRVIALLETAKHSSIQESLYEEDD